jgi:hypothetical protein
MYPMRGNAARDPRDPQACLADARMPVREETLFRTWTGAVPKRFGITRSYGAEEGYFFDVER